LNARRATVEDVPFIVALAHQCYPQFALELGEAWTAKVISLPNVAVFIAGNAVAIVAWQCEFWRPTERVADVLPLFGQPTPENPLGVYTVLKAAAEWAEAQGCYGIRFGSSTGAHAGARDPTDLMQPLAKRLGAKPWGVTYIKEF
jgi:hypothetical protein